MTGRGVTGDFGLKNSRFLGVAAVDYPVAIRDACECEAERRLQHHCFAHLYWMSPARWRHSRADLRSSWASAEPCQEAQVLNLARQELAGVHLEGQLFTVFRCADGQIVHLRD
jgi:hypothetical protein